MSVFEFDTLRRAIGGAWHRPFSVEGERYITGIGIDSRDDLTGKAFFAIRGETHDGHDFVSAAVNAGAVMIVIECDCAIDALPSDVGVIRVDSTRSALARLALAHRRTLSTTKVIAVTGSAGKTTTKRLIHSILSQAMAGSCAVRSFNNDIGVPLTILAARPSDRYVVVEIGTNAPGEISELAAIAEPDIAVITTIGRAHLEGLGTIENVAREKASLLSHLREGGTAIINADCPLLRKYQKIASHVVLFGEDDAADLRLSAHESVVDIRSADTGSSWLEINGRQRFSIALPGKHNALNALGAIAVARRMGVGDEYIEAGLRAAEAEPMRMAIECFDRMLLINDAHNANPDSVLASLRTFSEIAADAERRVVVLGEMLELGDAGTELHREIGRAIDELHRQHPIALLVLVGELTSHIARELGRQFADDRLIHLPALTGDSMDEIIARFAPGDAILLKGSRRVGLERIADRMRASRIDTPLPRSRHDAAVT